MQGLTPVVNIHSGCDYHRVILPLKHLGVNIKDFTDVDPMSILQNTRILFFNRHPECGLEPFLKLRERFGYKIVCDVDDYWELYPDHILYKSWYAAGMNKKIISSIKEADMVLTTTDLLASKIREINSNVHVVFNGLPFGQDQFTDKKESSEHFRILYAGGSTHYHDLRTIRYALEKLRKDQSLKHCQYILAGYNRGGIWDKIESVFNPKGSTTNYIRRNTLELDEYMDHYSHADVAIAPLENNNFNRYKSNLKVIEAGCKNIPCVATNISPYCDDFLLSKRIFLAKNTSEWYKIIKELAKNPEQVKDMGEALGEFVRQKYDLLKINKLRLQLFEHLINN
jgi:glycosyltransferase involved in cell wall biosynthesis